MTGSPPRPARVVALVARLALTEARRSRASAGLAGISVALLAVLGLAAHEALPVVSRSGAGSLDRPLVGATLLGTAAFVELLLGAIVAVFLAQGTVRGDADRGTLQTLAVRPVHRVAIVLGRAGVAAGLAAAYTAAMWAAAVATVRVASGFTPDAAAAPALPLAAAVALIALTAVALSTLLPAQATGLVTLTLVGFGFTAGLLAQLGAVYGLGDLQRVADGLSVLLPFEGLYRHVLHQLEGGVGSLSSFGLAVGPFGGARAAGPAFAAWSAGWALLLLTVAGWRTNRLDI